MIRLRLYIFGKNSKEVMYSSQCISLVDIGRILTCLIAGDANLNHLIKSSAEVFFYGKTTIFPFIIQK